MATRLIYLALFESESEQTIEQVLRSTAKVDGVNSLTYTIEDDKLRMILAALREANPKKR